MADVPTSGGNNTKYIIAGLLLLAGAIGLVLYLKPSAPPEEPAKPVAKPKEVERINPLAEQNLILEEEPEEPDAGQAAVVEPEPVKKKRVARPKRGAWDCDGTLDRAQASRVIAQNRSQVRTCYERRLKVNSILQGKVQVKLKIGANGKVTATEVTGSLRDNEVFGCVRRLAQTWEFPKPQGGNCAVVSAPFNFTPKT